MSEFGSFSDGAFHLKQEGEKIRLQFKKGVPVTGQGTVEWNIPTPADGCESGSAGAYAGMVILLSTKPVTAAEIPKNGKVYIADPTADTNLHVGDRIGDALVIGAVYECEEKSRGEELTTSLVISNLDTNTPYYVAAYATDCQFRYHSDGTRAYSDKYGNTADPDVPGTQLISFGTTQIRPTDGTNLPVGVITSFDLVIDRNAPVGDDYDVVEINVDGIDAGTYGELIEEINKQIKQANNPAMSPIAPNTGTFFYDAVGEKLYQFNGSVYDQVPALVESTDPTLAADGDYWYDTLTGIVYLRVTGSWVAQPQILYPTDIRSPLCDDYWYNGSDGKRWNGTTWCETPTIVQATDPSICIEPTCGTYWYDETNNVLYARNTETHTWIDTAAISWDADPQTLVNGTYWFNLDTSTLSEMITNVWGATSTNSYIQETEPVVAIDGELWYVPSTEVLSEKILGVWTVTPVLVWPGDPTNTASCDLWWNTTNDVLSVWDSTNLQWDIVANFIMSTIDPALDPVMILDSLWYNTTDSTMHKWDGSGWEQVNTIVHPTDPTLGVDGEVWHNTTNDTFSVWGTSVWNILDTIDSETDPTILSNGTYWFNTTNNALFVRNGITWISVSYTMTPLVPSLGSRYYNTTDDILYEWNGSSYVSVEGIATAVITDRGNIQFRTADGGSGHLAFVPAPMGALSGKMSGMYIGTGYADFNNSGVSPTAEPGYVTYSTLLGAYSYETRDLLISQFLWDHVTPQAAIEQSREGSDAKSGLPSYDTIGVGDDGSPDERRELADSLRAQLGHPVVTVELTPYQIDTAIQGALESLRKRSSSAYKRGFYFLDAQPQQSNYTLTNKRIGYNKIVTITAINRFTSAFLSTAGGAGVYGQVVMQHLYNMGTYDLTSFHLVAQYVEQMEHLFATRIVFNWDEASRGLSIFQSFTRPERLLLDCIVERTEQEIMKDRFMKSWVERYALSECQFMLAQIRGKYGSLPGAGGGIALNASELMSLAQDNRAELMQQIEDYIVNDVENLGMHSTFIIG